MLRGWLRFAASVAVRAVQKAEAAQRYRQRRIGRAVRCRRDSSRHQTANGSGGGVAARGGRRWRRVDWRGIYCGSVESKRARHRAGDGPADTAQPLDYMSAISSERIWKGRRVDERFRRWAGRDMCWRQSLRLGCNGRTLAERLPSAAERRPTLRLSMRFRPVCEGQEGKENPRWKLLA